MKYRVIKKANSSICDSRRSQESCNNCGTSAFFSIIVEFTFSLGWVHRAIPIICILKTQHTGDLTQGPFVLHNTPPHESCVGISASLPFHHPWNRHTLASCLFDSVRIHTLLLISTAVILSFITEKKVRVCTATGLLELHHTFINNFFPKEMSTQDSEAFKIQM